MENLYEILSKRQSRSSGTGVSFYGKSAVCGMNGRLSELFPYEDSNEYDGPSLTPTGKVRINGRRAGTFFHAFQELWRKGDLPDNVVIKAPADDFDYTTSANSFQHYQAHFNNDRHNLGIIRGVERTLPETDEQRERILTLTGGLPLTMRYDLLTDITADDCRLAIERQVSVAPGTYLIDYKLISAIAPVTMWQYCYDFQQLAYPVIYNACFPDAPVKGMITEAMARVQKPEPRHYQLYLAYADKNAEKIVRDGVRAAWDRYQAGKANPFVCIGKYGPCFFLTNGVCPRHGQFSDFSFEAA